MNSIMVGFALPNKQSVSNITTFKIYGFLVCCHSRYHATHAVKSKVLSVYGDMEVKLWLLFHREGSAKRKDRP
jgi:hypothetical protein